VLGAYRFELEAERVAVRRRTHVAVAVSCFVPRPHSGETLIKTRVEVRPLSIAQGHAEGRDDGVHSALLRA